MPSKNKKVEDLSPEKNIATGTKKINIDVK